MWGKRGARKLVASMVIPKKAIGTALRTIGLTPADSRSLMPSVRNCDLVKLGMDPMVIDGINKWTPSRKAGVIPPVSIRFSLSAENEQGDAGRDARICLARTYLQARTGTGGKKNPVQLTTSRDWQPYPVDPYSSYE